MRRMIGGLMISAVIGLVILITGQALAAPGDLDTTFNAPNGYVLYDSPINSNNYGSTLALQPDGKIVVVGFSSNGPNQDVLLLRYNPDGTFDNTFGNSGVAPSISGQGYAVAIQSDGKIVVVGRGYNGANEDVLVLRYNPDGTLDDYFGISGRVTYNSTANNSDWGTALALQPDGKIVIIGISNNGSNYNILVLRYNPNGILDNSFGNNGVVTYTGSYSSSAGLAVALQSDGKIIVVGTTYNNVLALRYTSNGILDNTFGNNGVVVYYDRNPFGHDEGNAVAIQPDGKIIIAGYCEGYISQWDFLLLRYNSNGTLDNTFGSSGVIYYNGIANMADYAYALALQPDGKIIVVGLSSNDSPNYEDFLILRYNSGGALDTSFGVYGVVTFNRANNYYDSGQAVAIQSDSNLLIMGNSVSRVGLGSGILILRLLSGLTSHTITATVAANGKIEPTGTVIVNDGDNKTFNIIPNPGYHVSDVLVDGNSVGAVTTYTFNNVTNDHTISATFAINTYTLTATAGPNGVISPPGITTVNYGGSQTFNITPNAGYHVADVLVDGQSVGPRTSYTFENVTTNHTISATFVFNSGVLAGRVTNSRMTGLSGVTINLTGPVNAAATTDLKGNYTFPNLPPGNYTITPCKKGYGFTPPVLNTAVVLDNIPSQNFTSTPAPYTLSGRVTKTDGKPFSKVTITLVSGACLQTATTDLYGKYSFKVPNGNYRLSAAKSGYNFAPGFMEITVSGGNQKGLNFQQQ